LRLLAELQSADGDLEETRAIHTRATARILSWWAMTSRTKHIAVIPITEDSNGSLPAIVVPRLMRIQDAAELPERDYLAG
jgi:hypothetical protein